MAFRTDSDWSLNKKTSDLIYSFSDGSSKVYRKIDNQIFEIVTTEKDGKSMRLVSDEEMTVDQFDFFKLWSDDDYHVTDNQDSAENRGKVDYDDVANTLQASVPLIKEPEYNPQPYRTLECANWVLPQLKLTVTQKRRLDLWLSGKSQTEIADLEGVNQNAIWKSLNAVKKQSEKILSKNFRKKGW